MAVVTVPEVERRVRGEVEKLGVLGLAFDPGVRPGQRRFEIVGDVLVELLVLLVGDLRLGASPQGRRLIDLLGFLLQHVFVLVLVPLLFLHEDGQGDVIGVLADDRAQAVTGQQVVFAFAQMQGDFRAARRLIHRLQRVFALPVAFPAHPVLGAHPRAAGHQGHAVRNDEGGIEAHAELPDQVGVLGLVAGQALEELAGARLGDGADVGDDLVAGHADAVVDYGEGTGRLVEGDADLELAIAFEQGGIGHRLEAQLVARVGGVGDQLAQENLLVAVQGVDHQVQQLLDLGLEAQGFSGGSCLAHL